jgi:hypothetical protein
MDIDFIVQDTFALVRPQWKLVTNLDEAGRAFADAVAQNYKTQEAARLIEPDESDNETSSEDAAGEDELRVPDAEPEDQQSSSEDIDADVCLTMSELWCAVVSDSTYRHKPMELTKLLVQIRKMKRSSSPFNRKSGTLRPMLNLIASWQS